MKPALATAGSVMWTVAVLAVAAIALQSVTQLVMPLRQASSALLSSAAPARPPAGVVRVTEGPAAGQLTVQMDQPFSDSRITQISERLGTDVIGAFPAFGTYLLKVPEISVDATSPNTASVSFPRLATWKQVGDYLKENDLTLVPNNYHRDEGGWRVDVLLPRIDAKPIDKYAGLWSVTLPGHPVLARVTDWATGRGFKVVKYAPATGTATLRGHAVPRPRMTAAQIADLLHKLLTTYQSHTTTATLNSPSGLAVQAGTAKLTWNSAVGASACAVWRSASITGPWTLVGRVSSAIHPLAFTDSTVPVGTFFYRVTSLRHCPSWIALDCDTQSPLTLDSTKSSSLVITTIATAPTSGTTTGTTDTSGQSGTSGSGSTTTGGTTDTSNTSSGSGTSTTATTTTGDPSTTGQGSTDGTGTTTDTGTTTPPPPDPIVAPAPDPVATDGHVTVSWPAVQDAPGYRVYRTSPEGTPVLVTTTTATHIVDVGGTPGTSYTYGVVPVLSSSAPVQQTQSITVTWMPATTTPVVLDMEPAGGSLSGTVVLTASIRTGDGAGSVTWSVTGPEGTVAIGTAQASPSTSDPLTWSAAIKWNSSVIADGSYELHPSVADGSGNTTAFDTQLKIYNSAPAAPTSLGAAPLPTGVALSWQQPAAADGALYVVRRDSQTVAQLPAGTLSWIDWDAIAGTHTYAVELEDEFGHESDSATATVTSLSSGAADIAPILSVRPSNGKIVSKDGPVSGRLLLVADGAAGSGVSFEYAAEDRKSGV